MKGMILKGLALTGIVLLLCVFTFLINYLIAGALIWGFKELEIVDWSGKQLVLAIVLTILETIFKGSSK